MNSDITDSNKNPLAHAKTQRDISENKVETGN